MQPVVCHAIARAKDEVNKSFLTKNVRICRAFTEC
ncbi:hypothetical protein X798_03827 [Onchocerca flexuosa]|uniref:Uncharacterized protein n=1 Tax=Onchocerca flexuosa TaxID=387005 RepID=A0A238BWM7_9BILA|nr:hypothetical protein X798_03827 [Onchocerca flexuosa]